MGYEKKKQTNNSNVLVENQGILIIQPFADISELEIKYIEKGLRKLFKQVRVKRAIKFPDNSMNAAKTRYRAELLISYLRKRSRIGEVTIGLTKRDISTKKGVHSDWGVFGLGYCPGNACIASMYRLKGENRSEKFLKIAIHELGHTQGLKHCPDNSCIMRDARGKDHLDEETGFCELCKGLLIEAGWVL